MSKYKKIVIIILAVLIIAIFLNFLFLSNIDYSSTHTCPWYDYDYELKQVNGTFVCCSPFGISYVCAFENPDGSCAKVITKQTEECFPAKERKIK